MRWRLALGGLIISTLGGGIQPAAAQDTPLLNVRFSGAPVIFDTPQNIDDAVRVYGTLHNDSPEDVSGLIRCTSADEAFSTLSFVVARSSTVRVWCDARIRTSTQEIRQEITQIWQNSLGKNSQEASLLFSASLPLTIKIPLIIRTSSFEGATATSAMVRSVLSAEAMATNQPEARPISPALAVGTEKDLVPHSVQTSSTSFISYPGTFIGSIQRIVAQARNFFAKPAVLVAYSAQKINEQQKFVTFSAGTVPTVEFVKSWLIRSVGWVLTTWWVMILLYFVIFRALYRLWRRARVIELIEDDGGE